MYKVNQGGVLMEPMSGAESYQRITGGDLTYSHYTNQQYNEDFYSDRAEHVTPRQLVASGSFGGELKNYSHNSFIEKRSRSVHLQEKSSEQEAGQPADSIFKRKNNELKPWQQDNGEMDNSEDSVDYLHTLQNQHLAPKASLHSRFKSKYKEGFNNPRYSEIGRQDHWEGDEGFHREKQADSQDRKLGFN